MVKFILQSIYEFKTDNAIENFEELKYLMSGIVRVYL